MGLPKEPRQKMINMMYLVLTALLALNVSSQVLEAFKTVNTSINKSNDVITDKNNVTYQSFADKLKDPQTAAKAQMWSPRADKVKALSAQMFGEIEQLKKKLKEESGLKMVDGKESFREDNLDATTRLMDENGKGPELYSKLIKYKQDLIAVLDPSAPEFASNPTLQNQLKADIAAFNKSLPLNMTVDGTDHSGNKWANDAKGWTGSYFHMVPTIAGVTILSKLQNDIKNSESQVVDYCHQQIGQVKVVFDQFQAIAQASSNYVLPGNDIEITAGVGAFSAAAKPRITVGGQVLPLNPDGTAVFKTKATTSGDKVVDVKIEYVKPDGSIATVNKPVKYTVGTPSGASIFLEKMNVLYVGVDNPLTISGGSVDKSKVKVSFPGGEINGAGGDHYIAKPKTAGMSKIIVTADGKPFEFPMRVKFLPNPAGFVGSKKGGNLSAAEFKAIGGLIARLEDSEFEAPFKVISYKFAAVGGPIPLYTEASNEGNRWTGNAASLVSRTGPGTTIFFDQITVVGPDGRQREIPPMKFNLK